MVAPVMENLVSAFHKERKKTQPTQTPCLVICVPLLSLIANHVNSLKNTQVRTFVIDETFSEEHLTLKPHIIFTTPDRLLQEDTLELLGRMTGVSIVGMCHDEIHLYMEWGVETNFRPMLAVTNRLRTVPFFTDKRVIFSTATLTPRDLAFINTNFDCVELAHVYEGLPKKNNAHIHAMRLEDQNIDALALLLADTLIEKGAEMKKVVIFVQQISMLNRLYRTIIFKYMVKTGRLPYRADSNGNIITDPRWCFVRVLHAKLGKETKQDVLDSLLEATSAARIYIGTSAIATGIDAKIHHVILVCCPRSRSALWQVFGRVCRDGITQGYCLVWWRKRDFSKKMSRLTELAERERAATLQWCQSKSSCRRMLTSIFAHNEVVSESTVKLADSTKCCDNCHPLPPHHIYMEGALVDLSKYYPAPSSSSETGDDTMRDQETDGLLPKSQLGKRAAEAQPPRVPGGQTQGKKVKKVPASGPANKSNGPTKLKPKPSQS